MIEQMGKMLFVMVLPFLLPINISLASTEQRTLFAWFFAGFSAKNLREDAPLSLNSGKPQTIGQFCS